MIKQMFVRDLKLRYERSVFGFAWTLLNPLAMLAVYTVFFSLIIRLGVPRYPIFLLSGLLAWNFVSRGMTGVSAAIWHNSYLINRVRFPHESLVISGMLSLLTDFLLELGILVVALAILGSPITPALAFLPVAVLVLLMFGLGVSLFFAVWMSLYRDTEYILAILSTAWLYMTPVFYPMSLIPDRFLPLYKLNPMVHLLSLFREPIYSGTLPAGDTVLIAFVISIGMLLVGWSFFRKHSPLFAELI
jgi:ABC-type polysaccharide/polyol phosphate export permease